MGEYVRPKAPRRITLIFDFNEWYWEYTIGRTRRAISPATYQNFTHCKRNARAFRELLVDAHLIEIVVPDGYEKLGKRVEI